MARVVLVFLLLTANSVCWADETREKLAEYEGLYTWAYPIVSNMKAIRGLMRGALPMFGAVKSMNLSTPEGLWHQKISS